MPYSTLEKQRAAQRAYVRTPAGREAKRRARAREYAKQKAERAVLTINPAPLQNAINEWRTQ